MAQTVKGLNIKLSADTTAVNQALQDVNKSLASTERELKAVDRALKLDPNSTTLLTQKQTLLSNAINDTAKKLEQLRKVKELADKDTNVNKNTKEYRDLERQIEITSSKLRDYQKDAKGVGDALEDASKNTSTFGDTLKAILTGNWIQAGLNVLKSGISAVVNGIKSAISGMVNLVKQGVMYNAELETYTVSIGAMLGGDQEKTNKLVKSMKELSKVSGYSNKTLLEGARNLLSADIEADKVAQTIEAMSRALYGVGASEDDLSRMITNLQGIASTGKATAQDLRQFNNIGVNVSKLVAEATGKTVAQVEKAGITFEDLSNAFIKASEEGGRYATTFEDLSGTFNAQVSKIKSNWQTLLGDIAQDTTSALATDVLPSINKLLEGMTTGFEEGGMQGLSNALASGLSEVINTLSDSGTIEEILSGVGNIVDAIETAFDDSTEQGKRNKEALSNAITKAIELVNKLLEGAKEPLKKIGKTIGGAIIDGISEALQEYFNSNPLEDFTFNQTGWGGSSVSVGQGNYSYKGWGGSGGFGALQSGGFNRTNKITLNANFKVNGQLDENKAIMLADIMSDRINENLGNQLR